VGYQQKEVLADGPAPGNCIARQLKTNWMKVGSGRLWQPKEKKDINGFP
jgi:hypothetical protein